MTTTLSCPFCSAPVNVTTGADEFTGTSTKGACACGATYSAGPEVSIACGSWTPPAAAPAPKPEIETEPCSRCGGCGRYSYCARYGSTCFRCGGKGRTLTKRGKVAAEYLRTLRSRPTSALKVGDVVRTSIVTVGCEVADVWATVEAIEAWDPSKATAWAIVNGERRDLHAAGDLTVTTRYGKTDLGRCVETRAPDYLWRVKTTGDEAARTFALAIEFQKTLTKTGTVRKASK